MKGRGKLLPGTPLRFTLRKECSHRGMNSSIDYSPHSQGSVLISALFKHTQKMLIHFELMQLTELLSKMSFSAFFVGWWEEGSVI